LRGSVGALSRIKQLLLHDAILFTLKARAEMDADGITDDDVVEAIINATRVQKTLRSMSSSRRRRRETLYVIVGATFDGMMLYTKGTIRKSVVGETLYVMNFVQTSNLNSYVPRSENMHQLWKQADQGRPLGLRNYGARTQGDG
jgi:hypothetical protein